jgi:DNA mismatch repair protein MutL
LLGREFSTGSLKAETVDENVAVTGFVSQPASARGNRSYQFFFVNGRPIRSIMLQAALERAFANKIPAGRFPSCVLYITIKPCNVDVNVHPAKTEVKFVSDKQVFDCVYYAAIGALERNGAPQRSGCGAERGTQGTAAGIWRQGTDDGNESCREAAPRKNPGFQFPNSDIIGKHEIKAQRGGFKSMDTGEFKKIYTQDAVNPYNFTVNEAYPSNFQQQKPVNEEFKIPDDHTFDNNHFRVIGETLSTYIIVEYLNSVWFIDKHAAHERIHFNALRSEGFEPMAQTLITPVICRHGYEDISILLENAELLDKLGFTIESFGEDAIAVRRIPEDIDIAATEQVLSEICVQIKYSGTAAAERYDNIFRSIACKAAIKAGRISDIRELEALAARVMSGEISQCPHGRPVAFEITKATLDKSFKRT